MARYTRTGSVNTVPAINAELEKISEAIKDCLSRTGSFPNQIEANLDFNGNDLLNVRRLEIENLIYDGIDFETISESVAEYAAIAQAAADRVSGISVTLSTYGSLVGALTDASFSSFAVGEVVSFQGYASAGDGGAGSWRKTSSTTTASQTPAQIVDAKWSDITGAVWEYVPLTGKLELSAIGAKGDGVFDNDAVFAAATASSFNHHRLSSGTYLCTRYTVTNDMCLEGVAGNRPVIKLKDNGNSILIFGLDTSNVTVRDLVVDGNKSNQDIGAGNNHRGIYFLGTCSNIDIENVTVKNVTDHGIFFSSGSDPANQCGKDSTVRNCIVTNVGSEGHITAGGAGGTGFVGGVDSTSFIGCSAYGNYLNGFKGNAYYLNCESYSNFGGGFETGFSTPSVTQAKWVNCSAYDNNGTGWRNQGQGDQLTWVSCVARGNGRAGILLLNSVNRATITSSWFINNGQRSNNGVDSRSDTEGFDGITITGTSASPDNITIDSCQFLDDQTTKTQEYHIYMRKEAQNVSIGDNNNFGVAKIQPFYAELDAASSNIKVGKCFGLTTYANDITSVALTGTTAATDLTQNTIDTRSLLSSTRLRLTSAGDTSGTASTKNVRLQVGGTIVNVGTIDAANESSYYLEAEIVRHLAIAYVSYKCFIEGQAVSEGMFTTPASFSSPLTVKTQGKLDDSTDSLTQQRFTLEQV